MDVKLNFFARARGQININKFSIFDASADFRNALTNIKLLKVLILFMLSGILTSYFCNRHINLTEEVIVVKYLILLRLGGRWWTIVHSLEGRFYLSYTVFGIEGGNGRKLQQIK